MKLDEINKTQLNLIIFNVIFCKGFEYNEMQSKNNAMLFNIKNIYCKGLDYNKIE